MALGKALNLFPHPKIVTAAALPLHNHRAGRKPYTRSLRYDSRSAQSTHAVMLPPLLFHKSVFLKGEHIYIAISLIIVKK